MIKFKIWKLTHNSYEGISFRTRLDLIVRIILYCKNGVDRIGWICDWHFSRDLVSAIKMQCDKFEMNVRTCKMDE